MDLFAVDGKLLNRVNVEFPKVIIHYSIVDTRFIQLEQNHRDILSKYHMCIAPTMSFGDTGPTAQSVVVDINLKIPRMGIRGLVCALCHCAECLWDIKSDPICCLADALFLSQIGKRVVSFQQDLVGKASQLLVYEIQPINNEPGVPFETSKTRDRSSLLVMQPGSWSSLIAPKGIESWTQSPCWVLLVPARVIRNKNHRELERYTYGLSYFAQNLAIYESVF